MSNSVKNSQDKTQTSSEKKPRRPGFFERLITLKGTAEEPWPTAEELWKDEKFRKTVKEAYANAEELRISMEKARKDALNKNKKNV